ncbi:MAG: hypothetical protein A2937_02325 [Candidatus Yonathbacteria bacterium RIFCSPLOWO2_01_FULL_47_33b]|uniref:EfeO-type cupredoxin-like domain-containing protein n=1 Tax=Candidatus Yonathbacteria bacterium RIFCSPLOWO2_01_FULL_47_33b TaxID=1802727 RepID=A0A1G2SEF2_9BACT|nr:MAG: hypothetical protein A2937_02325 [Candidatus Yonathbacteria bacterium RIFCSPLOWO2_01_FULL_47_33b]
MNKKYIIAVIVAVVALYGAFWFGKRAAIAPEEQGNVPNGTEQATTTPTPVAKVTQTTTSAPKTTTTKSESAPTMTKSGAYLVSYTDSGFVPAKLEIARGKSVHFVNNSNKAMSLTTVDQNSQVYREFNQTVSVGRGGTYDFTFLTAGTWWYVNRNSQKELGTIIVK